MENEYVQCLVAHGGVVYRHFVAKDDLDIPVTPSGRLCIKISFEFDESLYCIYVRHINDKNTSCKTLYKHWRRQRWQCTDKIRHYVCNTEPRRSDEAYYSEVIIVKYSNRDLMHMVHNDPVMKDLDHRHSHDLKKWVNEFTQ